MYYSDYNRSPDERETFETNQYRVSDPGPERPHKKNRMGLKITAACLACALVGGMVGGGGALLATGALGGAGANQTTVYEGNRPTAVVQMSSVDTKTQHTAAEIYAAYVGSVVGVNGNVTTNVWGQTVRNAVAGSGFVISSDGYILTNYHVIDGVSDLKVTFQDGTSYDATLVGGEEENDIAVLKIEAAGLTPVVIGDSGQLHVGDAVMAIGNPLGELTFTLTQGVVSALDRPITMSGGTVMNMIQTDTAINSGNSGGPLFNMYGEVIGITSAKLSNSTNASEATIEGLGFAIPTNDIMDMVTSIIEHGYVTGKPYLGVTLATVTESDAQRYGMALGVYVNSVEEGSAAAKAGLVQGDIITAIGDTQVSQISDLKTALRGYKAGQTATLTLDRSGKIASVDITFDEAKPVETQSSAQQQTETQQQPQQEQGGYYGGWPFGGFNPFG